MFQDRILLLAALAALLTFVSTAPDSAGSEERGRARQKRVAERAQSEPSKAPCCFKNPSYTGSCKVQPAEDETCASILAYLNNPMAQGKSYCGGTTVRQGWTEASCEEEERRSAR